MKQADFVKKNQNDEWQKIKFLAVTAWVVHKEFYEKTDYWHLIQKTV